MTKRITVTDDKKNWVVAIMYEASDWGEGETYTYWQFERVVGPFDEQSAIAWEAQYDKDSDMYHKSERMEIESP